MRLRLLIATVVLTVLIAAIGSARRFHQPDSSQPLPPTEFDQMQTASRVVVEEAALSLIRKDARPQRLQPFSDSAWPGFRGSNRISEVRDIAIVADWDSSPPKELWRMKIGEAWSGITVIDGLVYTQEQRDESDMITCYDLETGTEVWVHADPVRLPDSESRTGPRSTPECADGKVFSIGSTGLMHCLDRKTGDAIWSKSMTDDLAGKLPRDGMSCSPLVLNDSVVVFVPQCASGSICALDRQTGKVRWRGGSGQTSFSSPHFAVFADVPQILMISELGAEAIEIGTGKVLWIYDSPLESGSRMLQPVPLSDDSFLLPTGIGRGIERVSVRREEGEWRTTMVWESMEFNPYASDFSIHDGCLYGDDEGINCCVDLFNGEQLWKKGRLEGQALMFPDAGQQLTLASNGRLVLQKLNRDAYTEQAVFQAVGSPCLGHPAWIGDRLVIRNRDQMACFQMPTESVKPNTRN
ncbi:MAG: PQQ-binding-like beta-propeller repeat protein [Rubripirellula sp.]